MSHFSEIKYIQWGMMTGEQWTAYSVAEITDPSPKEQDEKKDAKDQKQKKDEKKTDQKRRTNTPSDPRLGEQMAMVKCATCDKYNIDCPGHMGHIRLPFPIYDKTNKETILKLLQCTCRHCARPLVMPEHINIQGFQKKKTDDKLKTITNKCKSEKVCPWPDCGEPLFYYSLGNKKKSGERGVIYYKCDPKKGARKEEFSARDAYSLFIRISNEHLDMLGFNSALSKNLLYKNPRYFVNDSFMHVHQFRPEALIWTVLPVIPPTARPYVQDDEGTKEDDLTTKYDVLLKSIKSYNTFIDESKKSTVSTRRGHVKTKLDIERDIMEHVWTLINNKDEKKASAGAKVYRSIVCRIINKEGRIQQNVGGKRTNFTARTVIIGGGKDLIMDQLGIPRDIAEVETKQMYVGPWNIEEAQILIRQGKVNYIDRKESIDGIIVKRKINLTLLPDHGRQTLVKLGDIIDRHLQNGDIVFINRQPTLRVESMMAFRVKIIEGLSIRLPLWVVSAFNADFDGDEMNLHIPQTIEAEVELMVLSRCSTHIVTAQRNGPVNGIVQDGLVAGFILTNSWNDGTITKVSMKIVKKIYEEMLVSKDRITSMFSRAEQFYPELYENGKIIAKSIPGQLFVSIVFPPTFCYEKTTNTITSKTTVFIEDGILLPKSGPLCKQTIGAKNSSIVHDLWKINDSLALSFLSDLQQLTDRWLPTYGFTLGIKDCMATSEKEIAKVLLETRANVTELTKKLANESTQKLEMEILGAVNNAMAVGPKIAVESMIGDDKNSFNVMRLSGAKGSPVNCTQIVGYVGQQNLKGQRIPMQITHGTRCMSCFLPGDNSLEARGMIESNYMSGLTPQEAYFHAIAGREGVISTSTRTAETGYIEKRIARKIDDNKVHIDGSVRDANGRILSFMYGDDGMDAKKLVSVKGLSSPFFVNPISLAKQLNSKARFEKQVSENEAPRYLNKEEIDFLLGFISFSGINSPVIRKVTQNTHSQLRKILPQVILYECKIPDFFQEVQYAYNSSKAPYGLMVGLIAASSIGEPATQMVLNSVTGDTKIVILDNKIIRVTNISELVDSIMSQRSQEVQLITQKGKFSEYLPVNNLCIPTVDEYGNMTWGSISAITRHPPHGSLVKITTLSGRSVIATKSKSFLVYDFSKLQLVPSKGSDINVGDLVPITKNFPDVYYRTKFLQNFKKTRSGKNIIFPANGGHVRRPKSIQLDLSTGILVGIYIACGRVISDAVIIQHSEWNVKILVSEWCSLYNIKCTIRKIKSSINQCITEISIDSRVLAKLFKNWMGLGENMTIPIETLSNEDFAKGVMNGLFSIIGTTHVNNIQIHHQNPNILVGMASVCSKLGIFGCINENTFHIFNWSCVKFSEEVGSCIIHKAKELTQIIYDGKCYNHPIFHDVVLDTVIKVEYLPEHLYPRVYDLTVPSTLNFSIYNGLGMRDTFHFTGLSGKNVTLGVPRFKQIINMTKSKDQANPGCVVYFDHKLLAKNYGVVRELEEKVKDVTNEKRKSLLEEKIKDTKKESLLFVQSLKKDFEESYVEDFLESSEMKYLRTENSIESRISPVGLLTYEEYSEEWWVTLNKKLKLSDCQPDSWVILLKFDVEKLYRRRIELEDIAVAIEEKSNGVFLCVTSPNVIGRIEVYTTLSELKAYTLSKLDLPEDASSERDCLLTDENTEYFVCRDIAINIIKKIQITGISGITKVYPREDLETHEYVLDTDGAKFLDILCMEGVDPYRTVCDDIHMMKSVLGISAARKFLFEDLTRVITDKSTSVNPRHIGLLADSMCVTGNLTAASRDGIPRDVGPNAKIMFEKNIENATTACVFTEIDYMNSLASSVMFGKLAKAGTGVVTIKNREKVPVVRSKKVSVKIT
jgi:DNA-directed RNA polymerase beta' subunit